MRGRQRLLWICTGLYTVLGGKNKGSATSRVCVFPLWYSTIFPSYNKLLSYTSTQFSKSLIAPSLSMTLFLNWQLCVLCSYRFVYWWVFFVSLKPFPLFPFSWICRPYLSFQLSDVYTELSKEVWRIKRKNKEFRGKWRLIKQLPAYNLITKRCILCLKEKLAILEQDGPDQLNKRSEIIGACRHKQKHMLSEYDVR